MRRFVIDKPEVYEDQTYGGMKVRFPLVLTPDEQKRQLEELGEPEPGTQQSWRTTYRVGLSLGFFRAGQFQTTRLVDFLCATLGVENGKKFRRWIEKGGGPPRPDDRDDQTAELRLIEEWLGWFEGLEVYGTITHSTSADGRIWANLGGPMPVGSLPGQPEPEYQALARGKARALIQEGGPVTEGESRPQPAPQPAPQPKKKTYEEIFEDKDDMPF